MFWIVLFWVVAIVFALVVLAQVGYVGRGREVPGITSLRRLLERENDHQAPATVRDGGPDEAESL
ncbi:hypothetical protein [Nocardioides yefusunii]|uniref:Uncharacterized protein n=1 Tax=Nocardioides yefusunii TaxID=2500546 RepID=A0ABW1QWJ5_9ACTN|nr:hypothetical protein [Nocardioides yefusunii]